MCVAVCVFFFGNSGEALPRRSRRKMTSALPERLGTERKDCKPWRSNWSREPGLTDFTAVTTDVNVLLMTDLSLFRFYLIKNLQA